MKVMHWLGIIDLGEKPQVGRWKPAMEPELVAHEIADETSAAPAAE